MDRILDWIQNRIPDRVGYRTDDRVGWVYEDMNPHKSFLSSLVNDHYADSDEGKAYTEHLLANENDIMQTIDHFYYVSTQDDFELTINRLYNILSQGKVTPWGEMIVETVNQTINGGV